MNKQSKDSLCLVVQVEKPTSRFSDEFSYYHIQVSVGRLVDERSDDSGHLRSNHKFITPETGGGLYLRGLEYSSQGDRRSEGLYGTGLRYQDVHCAEEHDLEMMLKTLRMVAKKTKKMSEKFGAPLDFTEEVMRVGEASGAKAVFYRESDTAIGEGCNESTGYERQDFGPAARDLLRNITKTTLKRYGRPEIQEANVS